MTYSHYLLASLRASLSAVAMVAIATVVTACSNSQAEAPSPSPSPPPEVDAAQVVTKSVRPWDEFTGRIAAIGAVDIRPRVSGYIERIAFKEGDMVKAGDLLFVIDPRPYRATYDSAMAQLERARASAQLAEAQNKRAESLIKTGAISIDTYDTRNAALGQTSGDVHVAEAALATTRLNLDFTEVRSPIAGRVSRALLTLGNLVQADQTVLTSVVSQDPVYVYFQPDEQSFLGYRELARRGERTNSDNPVRVGLASETGFPHSGTVDFVNNQIDAATGTINVRATVQSLVEIPYLLQGTDLIATLPERLVTAMNQTVPVKIFPLPMRVTETREVLVWHKRNEPDPGHAWMRDILVEVAREP